MVTRYRVWLDGLGLQDMDPSIAVLDVQESAPSVDTQTAARASGDGLHVLKRTRQYLAVTVRFCILDYDVERRKSILQKVISWAASGGRLTVNDRPEQYLDVVTETLPAITSALKWQGELTLTFVAYATPYWQDEYPVSATVSGTSGTVTIMPLGNKAEVPLEATITNIGSGTLTTLTISVGGQSMTFKGMAVASGASVDISMENGLLTLPVAYRTAESADALMLATREANQVSFSADQTVSATFRARGAWL